MTAIAVELVDQLKVRQRAAAKAAASKDSKAEKVIEKVIVKKDVKKDEGKKDLKSRMVKAAKDIGGKVTAAVSTVNKTLDTTNRNQAPVVAVTASGEGQAAKTGESEEEKLARNPRLHLPAILYEFRANINTIDLVGRMLWHFTDKKDFLDTAYQLYQKAELAFPDRKYIKLLRITYLTSIATDPSAHLAKLDSILKLEPSLSTRYFIFKRKIEVKLLAARVTNQDKNAVELINYVEFQKYFAETQQYNNLAIQVSYFFIKKKSIKIIYLISLFVNFGCYFCKNQFLLVLSRKQPKKWKSNANLLYKFIKQCWLNILATLLFSALMPTF